MVFYALSVIFPAMLKSTGWSRGDASIAMSISALAGGFLVPLAAKLLNKYGSRKVIIVGLSLLFINLVLLSTMVTKLWHWIFIYGALMPIARQLCGLMPSQISIMYWFNRRRAMAMGLLMTGAPLGGVFAPPVYTWFVNYMGKWQAGWMLSAGVVFLALIASFWVRSKPSDVGQYPDGDKPGNRSESSKTGDSKASRIFRTEAIWTLKEVLKTRTIWVLTLANICRGLTLSIVINHGVLHLTDIGYSYMNAAYILSLIIGSSGLVRFPVGWLGDRLEPRWIYFSCMILMLIGFIGIWKAPGFGFLMVVGAHIRCWVWCNVDHIPYPIR